MGRLTGPVRVGMIAAALVLASGCFWAQPGGGPSRQAYNALETAITTDTVADLTLAWEAQLDQGAAGDPITSIRGIHVNDAASVYGFDRASGARMWDHDVAAASYTMGQPSVQGDRVSVNMVSGSPDAQGGARVELDPRTGAVLREPVDGRVAASRGTRQVVFGESLNHLGVWLWSLTVVDTTTGTALCCGGLFGAGQFESVPPPLTLSSTSVLNSGQGILREPQPFDPDAVGNGVRAYTIGETALCEAGTYMCPNWATPTDGTTATAPVLSPDEATVFVGTDAGTVYAVDTHTGAVRWSAPVGSAVTDAPALAEGVLHVPTAGGDLVALAADGCGVPTCAPLWSASTGSPITQQPAVAGGVVFTGSADGSLNGFDAGGCEAPTCAALWSASVGSEITGAPAVSHGQLYVGTADGRLVAYALPSAP